MSGLSGCEPLYDKAAHCHRAPLIGVASIASYVVDEGEGIIVVHQRCIPQVQEDVNVASGHLFMAKSEVCELKSNLIAVWCSITELSAWDLWQLLRDC